MDTIRPRKDLKMKRLSRMMGEAAGSTAVIPPTKKKKKNSGESESEEREGESMVIEVTFCDEEDRSGDVEGRKYRTNASECEK